MFTPVNRRATMAIASLGLVLVLAAWGGSTSS